MSNLQASWEKKIFEFKQPAGTSRGVLHEKKAWFITVWEKNNPKIKGRGECSVIPHLSPDYKDDNLYAIKVREVVEQINYFSQNIAQLRNYPSIYFGLEMALLDLKNGGRAEFFATDFTKGKQSIPINGLVWMGKPDFMYQQIQKKLDIGFSCIKMKIAAIAFKEELKLLTGIRKRFSADQVTLRVDANGGFLPKEAPDKLKKLRELDIHSIEQPIRQGQIEEMRNLCHKNILPIALDEELIGIKDREEKAQLLAVIQPQYIILKPSLMGGFKGTREWIKLANQYAIPWWITSALESNVGLNAIAQFTSTFPLEREQGLGTGVLYKNNIPSFLQLEGDRLSYRRESSAIR